MRWASGANAQILARGPLGDQLFVTHQLVTILFGGMLAVLMPQGIELVPQGVEDRMVLVHGLTHTSKANINRSQRRRAAARPAHNAAVAGSIATLAHRLNRRAAHNAAVAGSDQLPSSMPPSLRSLARGAARGWSGGSG